LASRPQFPHLKDEGVGIENHYDPSHDDSHRFYSTSTGRDFLTADISTLGILDQVVQLKIWHENLFVRERDSISFENNCQS
jgi:hypothetical protein